MLHPTPFSRLALVTAFGLAASSLATAAGPNPYARTTPVAPSEPVPIFDFFRPSLLEDPVVNKAGTRFAARASNDRDRTVLLLHDLVTGKPQFLSGIGDKDIYSYIWLDDEHVLYAVSKEKFWADGFFVVDARKLIDNYVIPNPLHFAVVGVPEENRMQPIVWDFDDEGPMRLNMHPSNYGGIRKRYPKPDDGLPLAYDSDAVGELAFAYTHRDGYQTVHAFIGDQWRKSTIDRDVITTILGAGDKHGELIALGPRQDGKPRALQRLDVLSGEFGEVLAQDDRYEFATGALYRHPVDGRVLGIHCQRRIPETIWFDPSYVEKQKAVKSVLEKPFPGTAITIIGSDRAEKRFLVRTASDRAPAAYHMVDFEKGSVTTIQHSRPWIDPARMRPMQLVNFKTRDGVTLDAYLTLPEGASKQNPPPLIVLPHGGPEARDTWNWNGEVQFLASRGYAVLQPNYRGSLDYQWRTPDQDRFEFLKMHQDVTDATQAMVRAKLVDPDRIAIMGSSFGAYLSLCGVAFEPDLYRCAVTLSGVFDWEQVIGEYHRDGRFYLYHYMRRKLGRPEEQPERFDQISPVRHVAKIKVPVFVGHGGDDQIAQITQATHLISELEKHRVPFQKRIERSEGHGMAYTQNSVELYTEVEAFLAKHLAPRTQPAAAAAP